MVALMLHVSSPRWIILFLAILTLSGYLWSQNIRKNLLIALTAKSRNGQGRRRLTISLTNEKDLAANDDSNNHDEIETPSNREPLAPIDICHDDRIISRVGDGSPPELLRLQPSPYCVSQKVLVYRHKPDYARGEDKHYVWDGLKKSDCLAETENFKLSDTWIIVSSGDKCDDLNRLIKKKVKQLCFYNETCFLPSWKIIGIDYQDDPEKLRPCWNGLKIPLDKTNESVIPESNLKFYRRSMVVKRKGFMNDMGNVQLYYQNSNSTNPRTVYHIPYGVRSDMVLLVNQHLATTYNVDLPSTTKTPLNPVWISNRSIDVRYFWFSMARLCKGECESSQGRNDVAVALRNWKHIHKKYNVEVSLAGQKNEAGRQFPSKDYMDEMLHSKIVVVAQRDFHEDMYRLMEAFSSGALVFSDPMLFPPKWLVEGQHYVVYWSTSDLAKKLDHYLIKCPAERLKIANNGWNLVMQRYRSFHMMEDVVFGDHDL